MPKKKPTKPSPKSSHRLRDESRRGELKGVQEALAQIILPHGTGYEAFPTELKEVQQPAAQIALSHVLTAKNCHEPWQKSRGRVQ